MREGLGTSVISATAAKKSCKRRPGYEAMTTIHHEGWPHPPGTPLHGLPGEDLYRSPRSRVDLVVHHVLEPLVVGGAKEHLGVQLAARVPIVEDLVATEMVAVFVEELRDLLHVHGIVEGRGIAYLPFVGRHLHIPSCLCKYNADDFIDD